MCNPVAVVMVITAVASAAQQQEQADKQDKAIKQGYDSKVNQLQLQQGQINQQATEKSSAVELDALRSIGHLKAIGGDIGLNGNSFDKQLQEVQMDAGTNIAAIEGNRLNADSQSSAEGAAAQAQALNQYSSVQRPSLIGTGLQIAGAVANSETTNQNNRVVKQ